MFIFSISKLKIFFASIISNTLFTIVAESTEIFLPIFHLGCFIAADGFINFNFLLLIFKKGPPDAVINILSTFSDLFDSKDQIEKCSESTGINLVLFFWSSFFIKFHPQIIDSLLAIAINFVYLIISIVGCKPSKPLIELIT